MFPCGFVSIHEQKHCQIAFHLILVTTRYYDSVKLERFGPCPSVKWMHVHQNYVWNEVEEKLRQKSVSDETANVLESYLQRCYFSHF